MPFDDVPDVVRKRMARIRKTGSKPELRVRKLAHRLGYRYRINRRDLPGTPDIMFPARKSVIFVHGCFWHQHAGCSLASTPRTRTDYWVPKLARNVERDQQALVMLGSLGWKVLTIWECEIGQDEALTQRLTSFLGRRVP